jgi:hypothetical protein
MTPPALRVVRRLLVPAIAALLVGACAQPGGPAQTSAPTHAGGTQPAASSLGPRPASSATVEITQPTAGSTVTGATVHVALKLTGATIVQQTTTNIRPDEGHVHLYVNSLLVSMNYGLEQDIQVQPGTIALKAEFVAADHAPFNPRVWSPEVVFTVNP